MQNVSDKEKVKELQALDIYKDRVLGSVAHDIKSPLSCIITILECCPKSHAASKKAIQVALLNSKLLLSILNDFIDYVQSKNFK